MINKNDIKYFKKYGFIFKRNLIPASEIERCLMSANKIKNKKNFDTKVSKYFEKSILNKKKEILVRVENFLNKEKNLTKLIKNKKILSNLNILFNGKATLFKEKINYKLSGCRQDKLHQDSQAGWNKFCKKFISVLVALESSNLKNGCLQFDISGNNSKKIINNKMKPLKYLDLKKPNFESFIMSPGDVVFFNNYVPHKSNSNRSKKSRVQVYLTYNKSSDGNFRRAYLKDKELSYPPNNKRPEGIKFSYKV